MVRVSISLHVSASPHMWLMLLPILVLVVSWLSVLHPITAAAATAAAPVDLSFSADVSASPTPLLGTIYDSFGSSHGSTTLRSTWRSHFATTHRDIPFSRVRFHGILDDDMSTYMGGQANGALVFDTLDYLVAEHITPTIEIGFMPEELAAHPEQTIFHYKAGTSPPKDWARWGAFISQLTRLMVDRYSSAIVRTWRFEVWNEPNCGFYDVYDCCGQSCGNFTAYFELYHSTAKAIKATDSQLQVGGPATAELSWIPEFLAAVHTSGAPVDFVSSHLYPTDPTIPQTREAFMDAIANATALARAAGLPLLVTEFDCGPGVDALADTSFAAACLLHAHLRAQSIDGLVSMSHWTFTDFGFEEGGVQTLPWPPGSYKFGIQNMYGVKKPAYRGLQFISDWRAGMAVPVKASGGQAYTAVDGTVVGATAGTVDVLVSVADGGVITALLGNYDFASDSVPVPPVAAITLTLSGLTGTLPTNATLELIDDTHANPIAVWRAASSPLYPMADEIEAEKAASTVIPTAVAVETAGAGSVRVRFTMQPYAVARLRLVTSLQQPQQQSSTQPDR